MKIRSFAIAFALTASSAAAFAEGKHGHADDHVPRHGGIVAPGKLMDYELVASATTLSLFLSDHGKPLDASKASARLTLLSGNDKQEVELTPAGNRLEATGTFKVGAGTKVVAVVKLAGKPTSTARFVLK